MICFESEGARTEFHSLPVDIQLKWHEVSLNLIASGYLVTVSGVEFLEDDDYELSVRFTKAFDHAG